jgi:hypothetical protein
MMNIGRLSLVLALVATTLGCGHANRTVRTIEPPPPGDNFTATALESTPTPPAVPPGSQAPVRPPEGKSAPTR